MSFEAAALKQWDELVERGHVVWKQNEPTYHQCGPITFEIRVSPTLKKKPIYPPYASLHEEQEAIAASKPPFSDPDNDPTKVTSIGPDHTLVLNKFSFLRPQFVLHTTRFQPQETPLHKSDLGALADVLSRLDDTHGSSADQEGYIAFFNCGGDSGASVNHKHMQMLRRPDRRKMTLWPDEADQNGTNPSIPFKHRVVRLEGEAIRDVQALSNHYRTLCTELKLNAAEAGKVHAHNFIVCKEWMAVVPRSKAQVHGCAANAMGMLGMIWCGSEDGKRDWLDAGPFRVVNELGVQP